jgi:cation diffusion facilitator family transporter
MNGHVDKSHDVYGALPLLAARITVYLIAMLAILKLVIGIVFGSIAIVSEGIHTTVDLAAGLIAFFTLRAALKPPDKDHPYGHGKIENLMGLIQAGFIIVPSCYIIYRAIHHFIYHKDRIFGENLEGLDTGIGVMILTVIVNVCLGFWLRHVYRKTGSEAIRANAYHQFADLYTSLGVVAALFLVRITGNVIFDPIVAIVVASYAIFLGWKLMATSSESLLDKEAEPEIQERIREIIANAHPDILDFHRLRTRRAGNMVFGDIHIEFCRETTIENAHKLMDLIEENIEKEIGNVDITVHAEPCTDDCEECPHPGGAIWMKEKAKR